MDTQTQDPEFTEQEVDILKALYRLMGRPDILQKDLERRKALEAEDAL